MKCIWGGIVDENLKYWFKGFENAIVHIEQQERELLFCECSKNCVNRGVLNLYKNLYDKVNGDMDSFFEEMNGIENVKSEIVESRKKYYVFFKNVPVAYITKAMSTAHFYVSVPGRVLSMFLIRLC
ncbi:MAG: hypothetical protein N4A48_01735 [Tepidibacter sp.]|uniref:hypothetical protein n=1 Tax=Tepidibacter sp. TaxID=2529387 RepID=UPI0025F58668|nr:hypothetical protein [Tepidibacter sp.]MCT4507476.1 hypothetical protein [Tepidibacter sp.]